MKDQFHLSHFLWDVARILQRCYFGYFGHAWLRTPKITISTCRKLWFACQKCTSSFNSFLRYYILKNPAIYLAKEFWPITWEPEFCQIWDWWWNMNNNISFHFSLFPRKNNDKNFQKIQKTLFWHYFGPFLTKFRQKWVCLENRALSVFKYSNYLQSSKYQKKLMTHSCRTNRRTDKRWRPSVGQGSNKLRSINSFELLKM